MIDEREREETLSLATSSLAAVGTAWAAFQAATWSGRQTFALTDATKLRQLSSEAQLQGDQQETLDVNLFVAYVGAYAKQDDTFAQFLYERFPPRLRHATDAWLATRPRTSPDAPPHPFAMPDYQVEAHQRARALGKQADDAIEHGRAANLVADTYVLYTVILATIILLASLGARLRRRSTRRVMLVLSAVALLATLAWLATRPVAGPGA